ncbi:MAG: shikimate kinase [Myxococcota bacterium]|jgi:shikimate kinase
MAVGKSTVGRLLAQQLSLPFIDLDSMIAQQASTSIPDIFATHGEAAFRALETQAIRDACFGPPSVLALGGGALHTPGNLALLRDAFDVLVLTAPLLLLQARLSATDPADRPLLPELEARYTARQPGYLAAGPSVSAVGTPSEVAARLTQALLA